MKVRIIGISAYYHDSAVALVEDGVITWAIQEERLSRKKHDASFPKRSLKMILEKTGLTIADIDYFVFYDKPFVKFERLLETYLATAPRSFSSFMTSMPLWIKEKLLLKKVIVNELKAIDKTNLKKSALKLLFCDHHRSHAASAFFPSPFDDAAVLCLDGVGEWATTSLWHGTSHLLKPIQEIRFPHSLGLLYSAFTYYTGFKVNSGEYKLMGLAPYGEPKYVDTILKHLLDLKEDGSFKLNMKYFDFAHGLRMTSKSFDLLFGGPPRLPEAEITTKTMDIASSIQAVTEEIVIRLAKTAKNVTGSRNLCLAGGVALNCVANGKLVKEGVFDDIWIQPAAGDAGGAIGSALAIWHDYLEKPRSPQAQDGMSGALLGPEFTNEDIERTLIEHKVHYKRYEKESDLLRDMAQILSSENVVGWFQGRMEFGPRALGNRSIIGDPRSNKMQSVMNLKIKYRESFRPFAPSIRYECLNQWFDFDKESPYMLMVAAVKPERRVLTTEEDDNRFGIDKLLVARSEIPAITHVDYSARIQTVKSHTNPCYYALISAFEAETSCPILINTSFNVRGEPIVCTPEDAYRCFMRTEMDYLVMGHYVVAKKDQQKTQQTMKDDSWKKEFTLD